MRSSVVSSFVLLALVCSPHRALAGEPDSRSGRKLKHGYAAPSVEGAPSSPVVEVRPPASAPSPAPGSPSANGTVHTMGVPLTNLGLLSPFGSAFVEFTGGCMYGKNCGSKCESTSYIPGDPLDIACYNHDYCLKKVASYTNTAQECNKIAGSTVSCYCDKTLHDAANDVVEDPSEETCRFSWRFIRVGCEKTNRALKAADIRTAMWAKLTSCTACAV